MTKANESSYPSKLELEEAEFLVKHIEQDSRYEEIVKAAQQGKSYKHKENGWWDTWGDEFKGIFISFPSDFYGKAKVTDGLKQHARLTSYFNTGANIVDAVGNASFYAFVFQFLGFWGSWGVGGLGVNAGILFLSNKAGTASVNRNGKNRWWAWTALGGLIALNVFKTFITGMAVEIKSNHDRLQQLQAQVLIEQRETNIEKLNDDSSYLEDKKECDEKTKEYRKMPENDPGRDSLHMDLWGTFAEKESKKDWSGYPLHLIPLCEKSKIVEDRTKNKYRQAKQEFQQQLGIRAEMGNDFEFLKNNMPDIYKTTFNEKGEFISAGTQVEVAFNSITKKFLDGDFGGLGLNLILLSLSVITSGLAVVITSFYSFRKDLLESFDEDLIKKREEDLIHQWIVLGQEEKRLMDDD